MASFSERLFWFTEQNRPVVRGLVGYFERNHPRLLGRFDYLVLGRALGRVGPMNGQLARCELLREVGARIHFETVVETGTFLGATTGFLHAVFGAPVWTVESRPRYWALAVRRCEGMSGVHVRLGDSREMLGDLSMDRSVTTGPTLFYLDAHWPGKGLPLWEEISLILERWVEPLIIVDDFRVPDDSGYGYDDYGPGARLSIEDMRLHLPTSCEVAFPSIPAEEETGARRGCCFVGKPGFARRLTGLSLTAPIALKGS